MRWALRRRRMQLTVPLAAAHGPEGIVGCARRRRVATTSPHSTHTAGRCPWQRHPRCRPPPPSHCRHACLRVLVCVLELFDCHQAVTLAVAAQPHMAIAALSQRLHILVLLQGRASSSAPRVVVTVLGRMRACRRCKPPSRAVGEVRGAGAWPPKPPPSLHSGWCPGPPRTANRGGARPASPAPAHDATRRHVCERKRPEGT